MSAPGHSEVVIGQRLGNYRVLSLLGRGGMGAVYEGEHEFLGRKAAIKVMLPEYSHNADLVDRFFKEARATARLRHHAFVEVFDSGRLPDGSAYLAMELLEGESLGAHLVRRGALPVGEALTIARHIAEGVGYAHQNGIVHRDLKPDNVFLARGSNRKIAIKVLDFGIAKLSALGDESGAGARTRTGTLIGTPLYMAPEQCRGAGRVIIDHRADIYALGCILHAMIAGQPPFSYEGVGEIIAAHLGQQPPALGMLVRGVPAPIEALVLRMLAKDVDARPSNIDDVVRELERLATMPGLEPIDLAALPVAVSTARRTADGEPRAARETEVASREDVARAAGERVETQHMPPVLVVGATKQLQPAQSISTLSEAAGFQGGGPVERPRAGGRNMVLAVAALAVAAGGFVAFRAQFRHETEATYPQRPSPVPAPPPPPAATTPVPEPAAPPPPSPERPATPSPPAIVRPEPARPTPPPRRDKHRRRNKPRVPVDYTPDGVPIMP